MGIIKGFAITAEEQEEDFVVESLGDKTTYRIKRHGFTKIFRYTFMNKTVATMYVNERSGRRMVRLPSGYTMIEDPPDDMTCTAGASPVETIA